MIKETLLMLCCFLLTSAAFAEGVKVTVDKGNTLMLNGQRFFPLGVAPGPPADLKTPDGRNGWQELVDGGINYFRAGATGGPWNDAVEEKFANEVAAAEQVGGIGAWVFLRELSDLTDDHPEREARLRKLINQYKDSPAIYFWKNVDEPAWGKHLPGPIIKGYKVIRELDPDRPVVCIQAPRNTIEELRQYNEACDVSGADIYPVSVPMGKHSHLPNKNLSVVGDYTRRMVEVVDGKKPIFMVLQVTWSGVLPQRGNVLVRPTFHQQRYMMYQAIINGAKGLHWFGFPGALSERDAPYGWNWTYWFDVLKPLLSEIKKGTELNGVITAPADDLKLEVEGADDVEYLARKVRGKLYVFAAKREGQKAQVRLSGLGVSGAAEVMFEDRVLPVTDGVLADTFEPNAVHIYRVTPGGK